jgi:hypothetical protein
MRSCRQWTVDCGLIIALLDVSGEERIAVLNLEGDYKLTKSSLTYWRKSRE